MATQVQIRRGTAAENDAFTGAAGELTYDTTNKRVRIHDGGTAGGFELKTENSSGDTLFADNEKAIFGAGSDLQIYHDGSHSAITEVGTGNLYIQSNGAQILLQPLAGEQGAVINANGDVTLYYDNAAKLATTSTGIDVTGTVTADGLTVDGNMQLVDSLGTARTVLNLGLDDVYLSTGTTAGYRGINLQTEGATRLRAEWNGDISFYEDTGTTPKFFWDASAESLGIGTSSPSHLLTCSTGDADWDPIVRLQNTNGSGYGTGIVFSGYSADGGYGFKDFASIIGSNSHKLQFNVQNSSGTLTERMRIDSSGNLLVGTASGVGLASSSGGSNTGHNLVNDGYAVHSVVSDAALYLNRQSSDGTIIQFRKDGTTVGSIGTVSGHPHLVNGNATYDAGIRINADNTYNGVLPCDNAGALTNNKLDLGSSVSTFRNAYLSGGVYLGGTGSANYLDDYETGTFTPTISGATSAGSGTYTIQSGRYVKVGNLVHIQIYIDWTAHTGTGNIDIESLPFTHASGSAAYTSISVHTSGISLTSGYYSNNAVLNPSSTKMQLKQYPTGGGNQSNVPMDSAGTLLIAGTYESA